MGQAGGTEFRFPRPSIEQDTDLESQCPCSEMGVETGHPKASEPASLAHTEDSSMEDKVAGKVWHPRL